MSARKKASSGVSPLSPEVGCVAPNAPWPVVRLGDFATKIGSGSTPRGGEAVYKESGVPFIRSMNVHFGGFKTDGLVYIDATEAERLANVSVEADDVLLNITGASIGRVTTAPREFAGSRVNQHVCIIRPKAEIFGRFLAYFFASPEQQARVMTVQVGATRQALTKSVIENWQIPVPPLPEQRRIVAEIETQWAKLDAGVAALKRVQANLKRYRAAVLKAACEGKLVPTEAELAAKNAKSTKTKSRALSASSALSAVQSPEFETGEQLLQRILTERRKSWTGRGKYKEPVIPDTSNLPPLPEGWAWASMRQVAEVQLGRQRAPQHHTGDNMRPYLRVANVFEAFIDTSDVKTMNFTPVEFERYRLRRGDILLNEGQTPELVGRPAMFRDEVADCCYQKTLLRFRAYNGLLPEFALTVFRSYMHNRRFTRAASITTNIAHLTAEKFVEIEFPLPPLAEQTRIVAEVERRLSVIDELETLVATNLARATRLRQAVLKQAFPI